MRYKCLNMFTEENAIYLTAIEQMIFFDHPITHTAKNTIEYNFSVRLLFNARFWSMVFKYLW